MKTYLVFSLIALLLLGCKKEAESPKTPQELPKGSWTVVNEKYEYYNEDNIKVYQTEGITQPGEVVITDKTISANHSTGTILSGDYIYSEVFGSMSIQINDTGSATSIYNIEELTQDEMVWKRVSFNDFYYDGTTMRPSSMTFLYIEFKRK